MSLRSFSALVGAFLLLATATVAAQDKPQKLNVLYIVSDDLNNSLSCYGHEVVKSPRISQ